MMNFEQTRILQLAIRVNEQYEKTHLKCETCEEEGNYCCREGLCPTDELASVLRKVLEELFIEHPFLFEHNDVLKINGFLLVCWKDHIEKIKEYKEKHPEN